MKNQPVKQRTTAASRPTKTHEVKPKPAARRARPSAPTPVSGLRPNTNGGGQGHGETE